MTAVDPAGNVGGTSRIAVSVGDTTPPSAPTGLVGGVSGTGVNLSWSAASDNLGVAYYQVDRDGQPIATSLHATSLTDPSVAAGSHTYTVRAVDGYGNVGPAASITVVVVVRASQTVVIEKLRVKTVTALKLRRLGKHRVLVSWKPQKGAHRYQVLRAAQSKKAKTTLLATIKKVQYVDGHAPTGKLLKSRYVVRAVLNN